MHVWLMYHYLNILSFYHLLLIEQVLKTSGSELLIFSRKLSPTIVALKLKFFYTVLI